MTLRRAAAAASALAAIAWLMLFGPGSIGVPMPGLASVMWVLPLAFGLGTIALYADGSRRSDGAIAWAAGAVAVISAGSLLTGSLLVTGGAGGYAAWLGFVGGVVVLCGLVFAYGVSHRRSAGDRRIARLALVAGGLPFAFLLFILGFKLATGWWVTDPGLIAFGSIGAAVLVGGCWLALGIGLWILPAPLPGGPERVTHEA
jgi:hypothetical protein